MLDVHQSCFLNLFKPARSLQKNMCVLLLCVRKTDCRSLCDEMQDEGDVWVWRPSPKLMVKVSFCSFHKRLRVVGVLVLKQSLYIPLEVFMVVCVSGQQELRFGTLRLFISLSPTAVSRSRTPEMLSFLFSCSLSGGFSEPPHPQSLVVSDGDLEKPWRFSSPLVSVGLP